MESVFHNSYSENQDDEACMFCALLSMNINELWNMDVHYDMWNDRHLPRPISACSQMTFAGLAMSGTAHFQVVVLHCLWS